MTSRRRGCRACQLNTSRAEVYRLSCRLIAFTSGSSCLRQGNRALSMSHDDHFGPQPNIARGCLHLNASLVHNKIWELRNLIRDRSKRTRRCRGECCSEAAWLQTGAQPPEFGWLPENSSIARSREFWSQKRPLFEWPSCHKPMTWPSIGSCSTLQLLDLVTVPYAQCFRRPLSKCQAVKRRVVSSAPPQAFTLMKPF
jgi:hypothetical protein